MKLKEPHFWYKKQSLRGYFLLPLSFIYLFCKWLREIFSPQYQVPIPVICVGNITLGGSGKTPTCMYIAQHLIAKGKKVHIISRGYGRTRSEILRVDTNTHSHKDVGDEPLLLAEIAPTWVGSNRTLTSRKAFEDGADIILMDDGFQNPSLFKDLSIVVIDLSRKLGNGLVFPAGPLREPQYLGLNRADAILGIGAGNIDISHNTILKARIKTDTAHITKLKSKRCIGFCGIGNPNKFKNTLQSNSLDLIDFISFPDHHTYIEDDLESLTKRADDLNATLVTTRKDYVKLPTDFAKNVHVIDITIDMDAESKNKLNALLVRKGILK